MSATADPADIPHAPARRGRRGREIVYRHRLPVRLTHWINALAMLVLLLSGLQIFNAHPNLYWGKKGANLDRAILSIHAEPGPKGAPRGVLRIGAARFDTTGFLGVSKLKGETVQRGWPGWLTLPSWQDLALGRRWHLFFAWVLVVNGLVYLVWSLGSRHFARDLWPSGRDLKRFGRAVVDHLRLRHATGEAAKEYNILQKLAYLIAIVLGIGMVLTGLSMSPGFDAIAPWLLTVFGGRQSARTLHFTFAFLLVLFVAVHIIEVLLEGVVNELGSMITGRYAVRPDPAPETRP